ncbi:MAG: YdgA family protein [Proteobacteria bacterium]|nr:YdgA family protein [Pseudomonadota bacterium]
MIRSFPLAFAAALSAAVPALAQTATPEGAVRLTEVFQTYLGKTEGVVTVTPSGEGYVVAIDPSKLLASAGDAAAGATVSAVDFEVAELGGGKWKVTQAGPASFSVNIPGALMLDVKAESYDWSGVYDEALKAFESSEGVIAGLTVTESITQPGQPAMNVSYAIDKLDIASAAAAATGGVDTTANYTVTGLTETFTVPPSDGMPMPMDVTITADSYVADTKIAAMRTGELLDVWAWFVAHPGEEAVKSDFDAMKGALRTALPFFNSVSGSGTVTNLVGVTPMGGFSAEKADIVFDMSGATADGKLHEKIALSGLKLPEEMMPAWVPPLLPKDVTLDFAFDSFDLAAPAQILLDEMKPEGELSDEVNARLLQALLPDGTFNTTVAPSNVTGNIYSLSLEGAMTAGPAAPIPVGSALLKATGLDAVMKALEAAPPEVSQQAIPGIMMARGLAKPEGTDSYSWDIQMGADGKITVNGIDMSAMTGMGAQ